MSEGWECAGPKCTAEGRGGHWGEFEELRGVVKRGSENAQTINGVPKGANKTTNTR